MPTPSLSDIEFLGVSAFAAGAGISPSIVDAKGDIIVASADNTVDRLAAGSPTQVLMVDPAGALGVNWVAAHQNGNYVVAGRVFSRRY
jgi:hypothetical protein